MTRGTSDLMTLVPRVFFVLSHPPAKRATRPTAGTVPMDQFTPARISRRGLVVKSTCSPDNPGS